MSKKPSKESKKEKKKKENPYEKLSEDIQMHGLKSFSPKSEKKISTESPVEKKIKSEPNSPISSTPENIDIKVPMEKKRTRARGFRIPEELDDFIEFHDAYRHALKDPRKFSEKLIQFIKTLRNETLTVLLKAKSEMDRLKNQQ